MKKFLLSLVALVASVHAFAGDGTAESPYKCAEVLALTDKVSGACVKGYIVGFVPSSKLAEAVFSTEGASASNLLLADDAACVDYNLCVPVQLPSGSDVRAALNLQNNAANLGKEVVITGSVEKYFSVMGVKSPTAYTLVDNGGGDTPVEPTVKVLFESTFSKDAGIGKFSIENVALSEGLSYVWSADSYGYMKASAYKGGSLASDAWLISPVFDLKEVTSLKLTFDHCINKFFSVEVAKEQVSLGVRVDGGEWQTVAIPEWSGNDGWTMVNSGEIDLAAYLGKRIEVGFHYTSTAEASGTWEVKNFVLTGAGALTVEEPEVKPTEVANIAAFLADKNPSVTYKFTNSVNVTYQNGQRLYVEDETGSLLIYGKVGQTYISGNVIPAGFTGVYSEYGKASQLGSPAGFEAATATVDVAPEELAVEELSTDMVSKYVKLVGVTITAGTGKNYTAEQDGATVALYDQFGINPATGENLTVVGIYTTYNGNGQVQPIEVTNESGVVVEKVEKPVFTPGAGAVYVGTKVSIATATDGASIYYTTDGAEPTEASTLYTEPIEITEDVTIKAIAVKGGLESSEVVEAAYTIRELSQYKGQFDTFNNGKANSQYGTYTNATGWTATNAAILSGNEEGANDQNPKYGFIGDPTTLAVCINGKTSAVGQIVSPLLEGGVNTLSFKYGLPFSDNKIDFTVTVYKADGTVLATEKVAPESVEKNVAYDFSMTVNYSEAFKVEIVNNCPSASGSNKDRTAIWNLTWTEYSTGVAAVEANADAPVEYFNLQGIRVASPEDGIFIRRQGNKVEKVVIR